MTPDALSAAAGVLAGLKVVDVSRVLAGTGRTAADVEALIAEGTVAAGP
jgi:hypothetical protein